MCRVIALLVAFVALLATRAPAAGPVAHMLDPAAGSHSFTGSRSDTLWIFDADFEDLVGDNAGWLSRDKSGTPGYTNYWHKDTIRIRNFTYLGDSTWWCGAYEICWRQNRGYGNNWVCSLARDFPLNEWSVAGDAVTFEWDQRFALEHDYDYGYVDVSTDGGGSWTTIRTYTNPSFGTPGTSQDWNSASYGHPVVSMAAYGGLPVMLRFRVTSDGAYSSQDQYNNPPQNSCLDGAWQLDNFKWKVNGATVWVDDCEAPGDNRWVHEDVAPGNQTGVAFRRSLESIVEPPRWMMVAYDDSSGVTVDGESTWLNSPVIDVWGADNLVAEWWAWVTLPSCSHDAISLRVATYDLPECLEREVNVSFLSAWSYSGAPGYTVFRDDWNEFLGRDFLAASFRLANAAPESIPGCHGVGFLLDRFRVGRVVAGSVPDDGTAGLRLTIAPNPVGDRAAISYTLPVTCRALLRIYDLRGRIVRALLDGRGDAGPGSIAWDGRTDSGARAATGVYFVRLELPELEGAAVERKAVILR